MHRKYEVIKYLFETSIKYLEGKKNISISDIAGNPYDNTKLYNDFSKYTGEKIIILQTLHNQLKDIFLWMKNEKLSNLTEFFFLKQFDLNDFDFSKFDSNTKIATECYFMCTVMQKTKILPNSLTENVIKEIYKKAGFNMSRYTWIMYLCDNASQFFNITQKKEQIFIVWENLHNCNIFSVFHNKQNIDIFQEMNLSCNQMLELYYNSIKKACNLFLSPKRTLSKKLYLFFLQEKVLYVRPIECIFMYFLITERNPKLRDVILYDNLFSKANLDSNLARIPYIPDAITYHVITHKKSLADWLHFQKKWLLTKNNYHPSLDIEGYDIDAVSDKNNNKQSKHKSSIVYAKWYNSIITPGLTECDNSQFTRNSLAYIMENIEDWELGITKDTITQHILDTDVRRRWYFCRIISLIINEQNNYFSETKETIIPITLNDGLASCWVEDGRIIINRILTAFNYCFDSPESGLKCNDATALGPFWSRNYIYSGCTEKENDEKLTNRPCLIEMTDLIRQRNISSNKSQKKYRSVGRELLLMTVLLAKVYGVELTMEYVKGHILYNCRYGRSFTDSDFDQYFLQTFMDLEAEKNIQSRIHILQKKSSEFETTYALNKVAIFHEYFLGKH